MKSNKSYLKRLKVTKSGKIIARRAGQNHFNAKASGRKQLKKHRTARFAMRKRARARFLP